MVQDTTQTNTDKKNNNLPLEIKNAAGNQKKKFKIALKNIYTLIHFMQWKSTLVNRELSTVSQDFLL